MTMARCSVRIQKEKKMLYVYEVEKNPNFILLLLFVAILLFNEMWNK